MFILSYSSRMHLIQGQETTRIFSYWHSPSLSSLFLWLCDHHHMHNACQNSTNAFSTMKIATQWSQIFHENSIISLFKMHKVQVVWEGHKIWKKRSNHVTTNKVLITSRFNDKILGYHFLVPVEYNTSCNLHEPKSGNPKFHHWTDRW